MTLLALLLLSLLALVSRLISGVDVPGPTTTTNLSPDTAFGTTTYVGVTNEGAWEFHDPACTGPLHILRLSLSGDAEASSQLLRQPGEDVAYWYDSTIYEKEDRPGWLFRFAVERLRSLLHFKDRVPRNDFYLKIFYPTACAIPPTADWPTLASAIR